MFPRPDPETFDWTTALIIGLGGAFMIFHLM